MVERYQSCLLGLACGDAYGVAFEFMSDLDIKRQYPDKPKSSLGGGPFGFAPGEFSDDTEMAALTLYSVHDKQKVDAAHLSMLYTAWAMNAKDIGIQTKKALFDRYIDPSGEGNGALMRILPAAAYMKDILGWNLETISEQIRIISALTHDNPLIHAVNDIFIRIMLDDEIDALSQTTWQMLFNKSGGNSGWVLNTARIVYETLEKQFENIVDGFWYIISKGGDTDTASAVYGAIRGYREPGVITDDLKEQMLSANSRDELRRFFSTNLHRYFPIMGNRLLIAGQYPGSKNRIANAIKVTILGEEKVDLVINLMEFHELKQFTPYMPAIKKISTEVKLLSFPIRDMDVPDMRTLDAVVETILESLKTGQKVYVHCWGGHGRTGVIIGCLLTRYGMSPEDSLKTIRQSRAMTPFGKQPSPQTQEQIDFIFAYSEGSADH